MKALWSGLDSDGPSKRNPCAETHGVVSLGKAPQLSQGGEVTLRHLDGSESNDKCPLKKPKEESLNTRRRGIWPQRKRQEWYARNPGRLAVTSLDKLNKARIWSSPEPPRAIRPHQHIDFRFLASYDLSYLVCYLLSQQKDRNTSQETSASQYVFY